MMKFYAEIGLNHDGNEEIAQRMVLHALATPIDGITFQVREETFYSGKNAHQKQLSEDFYKWCAATVTSNKKKLGIAISNLGWVEFFKRLQIDFWKTLSWDLGNDELQERLVRTNRLVYLSTGLSSMEEIAEAARKYPKCLFIHTQLSQSIDEVNLKAIAAIKQLTGHEVAFGLHCSNFDILKMALGYEPEAIFFYVKEREKRNYIDNDHALLLDDVSEQILTLRALEAAIGNGIKKSMPLPPWAIKPQKEKINCSKR